MKYTIIFKNETITLSKDTNKDEYWLYDTIRGMNLSMRAKTECNAFVEAILYYQKRLTKIEKEFSFLNSKVRDFITSLPEED